METRLSASCYTFALKPRCHCPNPLHFLLLDLFTAAQGLSWRCPSHFWALGLSSSSSNRQAQSNHLPTLHTSDSWYINTSTPNDTEFFLKTQGTIIPLHSNIPRSPPPPASALNAPTFTQGKNLDGLPHEWLKLKL